MNKTEIKKVNLIKRVLMRETKSISKDKMYREGYKMGFNIARRKIRKALNL